jgi:hypothetical protein
MTPNLTVDALLARARDRLDRVSPNDLAPAVRDEAIVVDVRDSAQRLERGSFPART